MAHTPTTERRVRHVEGKLLPDALYTAAGLMTAIGLGEERLSEMRRSGQVKAHQNGNYRVYLGREVIEAILSEGKAKGSK